MEKEILQISQEEKRSWQKVVIVLSFISLISLVSADLGPVPLIPDRFLGDVTIDGQNAPVGTQINVYVNSVLVLNYTLDNIGGYNIYVKKGNVNDKIEFKILDKLAGSSTRKGGETINLDLSISTASVPVSQGSSGGGGGSGGGSGGGNTGLIGNIGNNTLENSSVFLIREEDNESKDEIDEEGHSSNNSERQGSIARITGFVTGFTGFLEPIGDLAFAILAIVLLIGVILIKFKNPKWKRRF